MKRIAAGLCLALALTACQDTRPALTQGVNMLRPADRAVGRCIALAESGGDPRQVSATHDYGLFQINRVHAASFQRVTGKPFYPAVFDPRLNGLYARALHDEQGWRPWTTHRRCHA